MKIICFAGPNGSGKSTIIKKYEDRMKDFLYVNADNIAREYFSHIEDYVQRNLLAAQYADELRNELLSSNQKFAFETVLSTPRNLELLKEAKNKGYEVEVHYVLTTDPNINVQRVGHRVSQGGHDVPESKIIERYHRCIKLLPEVLEASDKATVYDNSDKYKIICYKNKNTYYFFNKHDEWINKNLVQPLKAKECKIKYISQERYDKICKKEEKKASLKR